MEKHITSIEKNAAEEIRVALTEFKDHQLVDLRVYATNGASGEQVPTKKGLTVKPALLTSLIEALRAAEAELAKKVAAT